MSVCGALSVFACVGVSAEGAQAWIRWCRSFFAVLVGLSFAPLLPCVLSSFCGCRPYLRSFDPLLAISGTTTVFFGASTSADTTAACAQAFHVFVACRRKILMPQIMEGDLPAPSKAKV